MKFQYLGTAAAEGWPALFCNCDNCEKARKAGGKNIRIRTQVKPGLIHRLKEMQMYLYSQA